jgi:hypothetical protein
LKKCFTPYLPKDIAMLININKSQQSHQRGISLTRQFFAAFRLLAVSLLNVFGFFWKCLEKFDLDVHKLGTVNSMEFQSLPSFLEHSTCQKIDGGGTISN